VKVTARVAALLDEKPNEAVRSLKADQKPYWDLERSRTGNTNTVPLELIVNGNVAGTQNFTADGALRDISFDTEINQSSWVALRILPSSHTNPIFVMVGDKPIRTSRKSAQWCLEAVDRCYNQKVNRVRLEERGEMERAYEHARQAYRRLLAESPGN
jgi:hypothetical protein